MEAYTVDKLHYILTSYYLKQVYSIYDSFGPRENYNKYVKSNIFHSYIYFDSCLVIL